MVAQPGAQRLQARDARGSNCYNSNGIYRAFIGIYPGTFIRNLSGLRLACVALGQFSGRTAILEFFSTGKVAELARNLAQEMAKRYPPAIANYPVRMVSQQRLSDILEEIFTRASRFSRENKLGWYKRARLRYEFKWELKEMGYDETFIDMAAERLISCISRSPYANS